MRQLEQPPPDALWSPDIEVAACAFVGLSFASQKCTECTECNILRNVLHSKWYHVWEWMKFLYHNLPTPHTDGSHPLVRSFRLSIEDIFIFLFHPEDPSILSTEGLLGLAMKMWIQLAEDPPDSDALSDRVLSMSRAVMMLITSPDTDIRELPASLRLDKR
ncbi:hypothetical protein C0989_007372 [Termitomyces sp. Mn162]|nr:hypothetical protein C0989_007372 [Termitomyces sp. Mn162]